MPMQNSWYYGKFPAESGSGCARYAVIDRHAGSSSAPFASLNVGLQVGDERRCVLENRRRIKDALGLKALFFARQVHGVGHICINSQMVETADHEIDLAAESGCDALITDLSEVGLAVQHADCQAVLLYDPLTPVVAAVHCGWRGSVQNIVGSTVERLVQDYGVNPASLCAFIGPSLGPCCAEFIHYEEELPEHFYPYRIGENHFDFHAISRMQLVAAGLEAERITTRDVCTCCSADYFSYRRASRQGRQQTGRNCTVIYLAGEF